MFNILLKGALQNARNTSGDSACDATQVAKDFYNLIPEEIRPYFNQPRGVQLDDGTYLGSIVQIAKGSLGRLHGPALELFTASILQLVLPRNFKLTLLSLSMTVRTSSGMYVVIQAAKIKRGVGKQFLTTVYTLTVLRLKCETRSLSRKSKRQQLKLSLATLLLLPKGTSSYDQGQCSTIP